MNLKDKLGIILVLLSAIVISGMLGLAVLLDVSPFLGLIVGAVIMFIVAYLIPSNYVKKEFQRTEMDS